MVDDDSLDPDCLGLAAEVLVLAARATPRPWRQVTAYLRDAPDAKRVILEEWAAGVADDEGGYAVASCGLASDPRSAIDAAYILKACTAAPELAVKVRWLSTALRERAAELQAQGEALAQRLEVLAQRLEVLARELAGARAAKRRWKALAHKFRDLRADTDRAQLLAEARREKLDHRLEEERDAVGAALDQALGEGWAGCSTPALAIEQIARERDLAERARAEEMIVPFRYGLPRTRDVEFVALQLELHKLGYTCWHRLSNKNPVVRVVRLRLREGALEEFSDSLERWIWARPDPEHRYRPCTPEGDAHAWPLVVDG